ncbi:MAG: hypothetical protein JJU29_00135 [Verrucomicrobia bacterium]|nr:hypothetical protein [Verrucomicrobiota bacterium]MCH8511033.1 hypothetical protein [Kiritimatiellia bacterium]
MTAKAPISFMFPVLWFFALISVPGTPDELRTWTTVTGQSAEAKFVKFENGFVSFQSPEGREVSMPLHQLMPEDRTEVLRLAAEKEARVGVMPDEEVSRPTGRREVTWRELEDGDHWPEFMPKHIREAALTMPRPWRHAESKYFVIHFQQLGFARQAARMADFQYQFIASDLPGYQDRFREKSHIVIFRNREEWQDFLKASNQENSWFAAFVSGRMMYIQDFGNTETNANILAHEMSHLVLNRFFRHQPPLWLNEGLAEWYGHIGYQSFKGQRANPWRAMGRLRNGYDLETLFGMRRYPTNREDISRFYRTSQQVVGLLMQEKEHQDFVRYLQAITVEGKAPLVALREVYGYESVADLQKAFDRFVR